MDQRSRVHPACRSPTRARPLAVANGAVQFSRILLRGGPGCGAQEKDALWRPWRGNEPAGSEAHSERSRDGGGVSVPGPCGLRTATGGDHPRVGCWVFGRPAAGTGAPSARLLPIGTATRLSHASWVGLAAHKADSFSGCGQACASTTFLLGLRTGCAVCPSPAQAASSRAATTTVVRMTRIPHLPGPRL